MKTYNPSDWYWIVADDASRVYSSKLNDYVPATDPAYVEWSEDGSVPTQIDTEFNLGVVLAPYGLEPIPRGIHKGYAAEIDRRNALPTYTKPLNPALDGYDMGKTAAQILGA